MRRNGEDDGEDEGEDEEEQEPFEATEDAHRGWLSLAPPLETMQLAQAERRAAFVCTAEGGAN